MRWGDDERLSAAADKLSAIAGVLLHSHDQFGWLLAKLCSEVVRAYARDSLRARTDTFRQTLSAAGQAALESYLRLCYTNLRTVAWPAQVRGIAALLSGESFALCTPTGSGKTAVAELAIIQGLFGAGGSGLRPLTSQPESNSLVLYLTPSRALATEVEARLGSVLRRLSDEAVIVTGLYGGTDWGPTDAWLTTQDRAV